MKACRNPGDSWWPARGLEVAVAMLAVVGSAVSTAATGAEEQRPNVLLICVDDLRPELGCYGCEHIKSPNIERLAREGRRFTRHYVEVAVCGPSRCTLLKAVRVHGS